MPLLLLWEVSCLIRQRASFSSPSYLLLYSSSVARSTDCLRFCIISRRQKLLLCRWLQAILFVLFSFEFNSSEIDISLTNYGRLRRKTRFQLCLFSGLYSSGDKWRWCTDNSGFHNFDFVDFLVDFFDVLFFLTGLSSSNSLEGTNSNAGCFLLLVFLNPSLSTLKNHTFFVGLDLSNIKILVWTPV